MLSMTYIFVSVDNANSRSPHESVGVAKRFLQLESRQKGSLGVHFVDKELKIIISQTLKL